MNSDDNNNEKNMDQADEFQDDIVMEDEQAPGDQIKKLRAKLKKALEEKQDYLDKWQRAQAEFLNARKRDQEEKAQFAKFAKEDLISQIIPVLEGFDMARSNKDAWEKVDPNWRKGVESLHALLLKVMAENDLKELNPIGEKFDPMRDEAIAHEPVDSPEKDHVILDVVQKGYSLAGKVVKAPRVKVGDYIPK
jgi:molecular chaperone GrpE (heat shock protein)